MSTTDFKRLDNALSVALAGPMKALTLYQPWASLMAFEEKRIETRSWATHYRGPLAIHAAKYVPRPMYSRAMNDVWFQTAVNTHGVSFAELPRSRVLCVVDLIGCVPVSQLHKAAFLLGIDKLGMKELALGDYTDGRFAWVTKFIGTIDDPSPTDGGQRLWNWVRGPKSPALRQSIAHEAIASGEMTL